MRKLNLLLMLFCLGMAGCATPLIESDSHVSIYVVGAPKVDHINNEFSIRLRYKSPTSDPHLVQHITFNGTEYKGTESFSGSGWFWQMDHHFNGPCDRTMVIMPGEVEGTDEALDGFSMLPDNWPPGFNEHYTSGHAVRGKIIRSAPERATTYRLRFDGQVLTLSSGDTIFYWR